MHNPRARAMRLRWLAALAMAGTCSAASAVDYSYSGFLNVTAGKVFGASGIESGYPDNGQWTHCPCYVADFSHGSVYESKWSLAPETRAGLQGTAAINADLSFTGQLMARTAARKSQLDLEWAFLSYNLSPKFTLQVGRKRLPLFFYSDFQDVSYAYNWARVPPDVYGWAVVNYNGANLTYRDELAGWAIKSNAYVGSENAKDDPIAKLSGPARTDVRWSRMMGIDVELNRDWLTVRAAVSKSRQRGVTWGDSGPVQTSPDPAVYGSSSPQGFYSLAVNADKDDIVIRTELSKVDRSPARGSYKGFLVSGGYRFGKFLPLVTVSRLNAYDGQPQALVEVDRNVGATLRYQLSDDSSVKLQIDRSNWNFLNGTNSLRKLATVSYDRVF